MIATNHPNVLVVGSGPVGLALACQLRRLGLSVRILDKKPGPSTTSKAIGLQYRVSEILASMGVVDRFIARGGSPTVVNMYEKEKRLLALRFKTSDRLSGHDAFTPRPIMIPQSETEAILSELLAKRGCTVEWGTEFVDYMQDRENVVSRIRRPCGLGGPPR